ncbi:MAG: Xylulose kinase [candidate division BRC1 bacterium ADurb.BinA364]|nr:MAG: Xylulose kinase [candidate division BRC1 bacterium ADurb.BinA364]
MSYLIGMDVGTTGIKSILMEEGGKILASSFVEYPLLLPKPGWAEQHPEDWWEATKQSLSRLLGESGVDKSAIKGLSFSGQMHGLVCLDENDKPLRPAILWCDLRTTPQCKSITDRIGYERLIELVSNPALEGFTLPKVVWVKENEPSVWARVRSMMLPKDYVCFRLTGRKGMEVSDGAGSLMMDVANNRWCSALLKELDIDEGLLPALHRSIDVAGQVGEQAARETGLPAGLPIVYGGADNACAAVGNGVVEEGLVTASIGTSGTTVAPTSKPVLHPEGRLHSFNHAVPGMWYLMGCMQAAGLSFKWIRDQFGAAERAVAERTGRDPYEFLTAEAERSAPGAEGLVWLPYLSGERTPHLDANAKGCLFGVTARHTRSHVIRAILEGVTFGMRDGLELMKALGTPIRQIRLTGGGAKSALWRQIQADIYGQPVATINVDEGPAFGAAIIAGVGVGVYKDFASVCSSLIQVTRTIDPIPENVARLNDNYALFRELYPALKGSMAKAGALA